MKNKVLVSVVILSLLTFSGSLAAKERRGAEVKILKKDRMVLKGELIAVKPASLLLMDSQSGADLSVDIEDINTITIIKKSRAKSGLLIGFGAGLAAGTAIAKSGPRDSFMFSDQEILGMMVWSGLTLCGLIAGIIMGTDQTFQPPAMTSKETEAVLKKLRTQARITDFQ